MSEKPLPVDSTTVSTTLESTLEKTKAPGFFRRYRLPLFLAVVAVCLYAGSILYILFGRGQVT